MARKTLRQSSITTSQPTCRIGLPDNTDQGCLMQVVTKQIDLLDRVVQLDADSHRQNFGIIPQGGEVPAGARRFLGELGQGARHDAVLIRRHMTPASTAACRRLWSRQTLCTAMR